jgi:hypothetical protein
MVVKRDRDLNNNIKKEEVKFYGTKISNEHILNNLFEDFTSLEDDLILEYSEGLNLFYFSDAGEKKNLENILRDFIFSYNFVNYKENSELGSEKYEKYYNEFYKTNNRLDRKFQLDDRVTAILKDYDDVIEEYLDEYM